MQTDSQTNRQLERLGEIVKLGVTEEMMRQKKAERQQHAKM